MRFPHRSSETCVVEHKDAARVAHDALLALQPDGAEHATCDLCPEITNKEVAKVAGEDRTYTEAEHLALSADAVKRETADLSEAKATLETQVSEKAARVDVLEAEKAALETAKAELQTAFDTYKAEVERAREVEIAKQDRVAKIKAANEQLPETYFTDERIQAWAEMDEATFTLVLDGLTALAGAPAAGKETAAFSGGTAPTSTDKPTVGGIFAARRGANKN